VGRPAVGRKLELIVKEVSGRTEESINEALLDHLLGALAQLDGLLERGRQSASRQAWPGLELPPAAGPWCCWSHRAESKLIREMAYESSEAIADQQGEATLRVRSDEDVAAAVAQVECRPQDEDTIPGGLTHPPRTLLAFLGLRS